MAKIISAKRYPDIPRVVMLVVANPNDPEWAHPGGEPHSSTNGRGPDKVTLVAAPDLGPGGQRSVYGGEGDVVLGLAAGTECHACRYNWQVSEHIWTGNELFIKNGEGKLIAKTRQQILVELKERVAAPAALAGVGSLEGTTV